MHNAAVAGAKPVLGVSLREGRLVQVRGVGNPVMGLTVAFHAQGLCRLPSCRNSGLSMPPGDGELYGRLEGLWYWAHTSPHLIKGVKDVSTIKIS